MKSGLYLCFWCIFVLSFCFIEHISLDVFCAVIARNLNRQNGIQRAIHRNVFGFESILCLLDIWFICVYVCVF